MPALTTTFRSHATVERHERKKIYERQTDQPTTTTATTTTTTTNNKKFELMLTRCAKAYNSSGSVV